MRINKTTTVGAVAACAVIGATSPVWADSGSGTSSNDQTAGAAEQAAVLNALQAEIAKLKDEVKADENALQAATQAAKAEADALAKARAAAAHWKAVAQRKSVRTVTVPAAASTFNRDAGESNDSTDATDGHKWCHHHNGY
ncbi:MAG TPA: hypothetical protein VHE56_03655, partial [Mycobacteriales bacterium]|nr:hypothetical protein [Mycobacteriales bacterium]